MDSWDVPARLKAINPLLDDRAYPRSQRAARSATHKYIGYETGPGEFYDLRTDPEERENILTTDDLDQLRHLRQLQTTLVAMGGGAGGVSTCGTWDRGGPEPRGRGTPPRPRLLLMTPTRRQVRILAFAYACEPDRGSEPAVGWWWARMLAELGETWVITRANNRFVIERALETTGPLPNVHFVYVDLPPNRRRWKRGQRGIRLYYLLWQRAALREARRLAREQPFDLAWHLTLANVWIGSAACFLGVPFVYGPVGGAVAPPWRLAGALGTKGMLYELLRAVAHMSGRYLNPLSRASWRRASLILVQNEETKRWLPRHYQDRAEVFPNVILEQLPAEPRHDAGQVMLYAGRLMPLKGVSLAIRALESLPGWRLIVCGDGPDAARLRRLAAGRGLGERVDFRGWIEREQLLRTMREEASVFVFPSFHDEAGWVVVEAMAAGLPVVCLDVGGPPILAGHGSAVTPAGQRGTAERIAQRVLEVAEADPEAIRERARSFLIERRSRRLAQLLRASIYRLASADRAARRLARPLRTGTAIRAFADDSRRAQRTSRSQEAAPSRSKPLASSRAGSSR